MILYEFVRCEKSKHDGPPLTPSLKININYITEFGGIAKFLILYLIYMVHISVLFIILNLNVVIWKLLFYFSDFNEWLGGTIYPGAFECSINHMPFMAQVLSLKIIVPRSCAALRIFINMSWRLHNSNWEIRGHFDPKRWEDPYPFNMTHNHSLVVNSNYWFHKISQKKCYQVANVTFHKPAET